MNQLQRTSLPDQVAAIPRRGIAAARWSRELPSEAKLCRDPHVGRVTLRKAIAQVVRERWITLGGGGCHHRIRRKPKTSTASRGQVIRVLSPYSLSSIGAIHHVILDHVVERIAGTDYHIEYEHNPGLYQRHQPAKLRHLDSLSETADWLLFF